MVRYQVFLCLDTYDTDTIAINKLNFRFFYHVLSYKSAAGSGFLKEKIWCITKIKIL